MRAFWHTEDAGLERGGGVAYGGAEGTECGETGAWHCEIVEGLLVSLLGVGRGDVVGQLIDGHR